MGSPEDRTATRIKRNVLVQGWPSVIQTVIQCLRVSGPSPGLTREAVTEHSLLTATI